MISNRFLVGILIIFLCSCKSQYVAPIILKDSVSITYKQGKDPIPAFPSKGKESNLQDINHLCNQPRVAGDNNRSYEVATRYDGKPKSLPSGGGAKSVESVESVRDLKIRVDTVFIERWHTEIVESQKKKVESAKPDKPIPRFYKDCTWGFFILILLLLGRIAFRIMKAIYLRR